MTSGVFGGGSGHFWLNWMKLCSSLENCLLFSCQKEERTSQIETGGSEGGEAKVTSEAGSTGENKIFEELDCLGE